MNIVKITNRIALVTVICLVYWVFIFICSSVFGFKVFRQNMTEMFFLSVLGIFAILSGAIILNIMFNLTAIAEGREAKDADKKPLGARVWGLIAGSFVAIFALLFLGDLATTNKKQTYLTVAASDLVKEQKNIIDGLADYAFTSDYLKSVDRDITILSDVEEKFPSITVIVRDEIRGKPYLLGFSGYIGEDAIKKPKRENHILSTSSEERKYLHAVFDGKTEKHRFSAYNGRYEIYFPVASNGKTIVLHFAEWSRYGKFGS